MVRTIVGAALALVVFVGVSTAADPAKADKKKGAGVTGVVKKIEGNKITLAVGKKGEEKETVYTIGDEAKFVIAAGEEKKELSAKEGLKAEQLKVGARVALKLEGDKVIGVQINMGKKKDK